MMTTEQLNNQRLEWNTKCCKMLETILTEFPFLRLGQLMENVYGDDEMFYEEPQYTYKKLENYYHLLQHKRPQNAF